MVTKYDLFFYLGERNTPVTTSEILRNFNKRKYEYPNIYRMLVLLLKEDLAFRSNEGFQIKINEKSQLLYRFLTYCTSNGLNYNPLLDKELALFISRALIKAEFTSKDFSIDPKTFKKYTTILLKGGLLVKISNKPFKARIIWNHLLSNLLQYYKIPVLVKKEKDVVFIGDIKNELSKFNRLAKKNEQAYQKMLEDHKIKFIHSSLALEGNPITLPDTIKILKEKLIPKDLKDKDIKEIQNYQAAVKSMLDDALHGNRLTKEKILNFHYLAMVHLPEIAGKIRNIPVYIKGNPNFKISTVDNIQPLLDRLMEKYDKFTLKKQDLNSIIEFACFFHNQFQFIHPFVDGNSRISRLLTFHILQFFRIPVLDIPLGILDLYLQNTKGYKAREDKELEKTLQMIILYNLKAINEKMSTFLV